MLESVLAGHEFDELLLARYAKAGVPNPIAAFEHTNPRVVLREHARLATLPQGTAESVRKIFQAMRDKGSSGMGEADLLERATRGVGGRPGITYGAEGTRLSRHAQKRVSHRMQELLAVPVKRGG
jgi:hypothetical protein